MNEKDIFPILEGLGWRCKEDEVGDHYCLMDVGCAQVQVIPSVGVRSDHYRVSFMPSVSIARFTAAVSFFLGGGEVSDHVPIVVSNIPPEKIASFSVADVVRLSQKSISWASAQDIDAGLAVYMALTSNSKGAMPLRHLAALALARDVSCFVRYQRSFEQGDRLGFVPYIYPEMIDRALQLAQSSE